MAHKIHILRACDQFYVHHPLPDLLGFLVRKLRMRKSMLSIALKIPNSAERKTGFVLNRHNLLK